MVEQGRILINKLGAEYAAILKKSIDETEQISPINFILGYNQTITLTVKKIDKSGKVDSEWEYTLKTPEKSRWLVHYGLTYAPSILSKVDHFHAFADTSVANRYTITKDNTNGPKPWDNICSR